MKHTDAFCPTSCCLPYSSSFPLHWQSPTPVQPFSWNSVLGESIREALVRHSHPTPLSSPDRWWHSLALYLIHCLPLNWFRRHLHYGRGHSSQANFPCPKFFQVQYSHHFLLNDGWFVWFGAHSILELFLQGGSSQTELVAKVIFSKISM